jgi:hypothetical protein
MKNYFVVVLLLLAGQCVFGQMGMGKIEEIESIQTRKLIVMIEEPDEKQINRISKKAKRGNVEDYLADVRTLNDNLKLVIEKFWPYNKNDIQYKTLKEILVMGKTKTKDYAVLSCYSAQPLRTSAGYNYYKGLYWDKDIKGDLDDRDDLNFTVMTIEIIEEFGGVIRPVYSVPLFDVFPTKASLVHGVKSIQAYFDMRIAIKKEGSKRKDEVKEQLALVKANAPKLATKTLLIRKEWLDEELSETTIKNFYPYPYQVCDREFMDQVIMDQNPTYACGVILRTVYSGSASNASLFYQAVFDVADNSTMSIVKPKIAIGLALGKSGKSNFTAKTLTKIVEQVKGSTSID